LSVKVVVNVSLDDDDDDKTSLVVVVAVAKSHLVVVVVGVDDMAAATEKKEGKKWYFEKQERERKRNLGTTTTINRVDCWWLWCVVPAKKVSRRIKEIYRYTTEFDRPSRQNSIERWAVKSL